MQKGEAMTDYDTLTRLFYLKRERSRKAKDAKDDKKKGVNFFHLLEDYPSTESWPEREGPPLQ